MYAHIDLTPRVIVDGQAYRRAIVKVFPRSGGVCCHEGCPRHTFVCTRPPDHKGPHVAHWSSPERVCVYDMDGRSAIWEGKTYVLPDPDTAVR